MDARLFASTIIFSMVAGIVTFVAGYVYALKDKYTCEACGAKFSEKHYYDWHLISFCDTQCMDEECVYRLSLGNEHSVDHHENPL